LDGGKYELGGAFTDSFTPYLVVSGDSTTAKTNKPKIALHTSAALCPANRLHAIWRGLIAGITVLVKTNPRIKNCIRNISQQVEQQN